MAADAYLWAQNWVVSGLHFAGIVKPNPAVKAEAAAAGPSANTAGEAVAATTETVRAAVTDPSVLKDAVEKVAQNVANVAAVSKGPLLVFSLTVLHPLSMKNTRRCTVVSTLAQQRLPACAALPPACTA